MEKKTFNQHNIQEGDLLAYLDGEASSMVHDHVIHCAVCMAEAMELQQLRVELLAEFFRGSCPSTEQIMQYQIKELPRKQMRDVKKHLADCQHCRAELAELASVLVDKPEPNWLDQLTTAGRQILAAVLLPGPSMPALVLRGKGQQEQTHQTYQAGNYQVKLTIIAPPLNEGLWQIQGKVTSAGAPSVEMHVHLWQENQMIVADDLDEFGYFELQKVKGGTYTLAVESANTSIVIFDFKLL